jgi:hypothetical protein
MTRKELEMLKKLASGFSLNTESIKELIGPVVSIYPFYAMIIVLIWLFIAWIVRVIFVVDFGWDSQYSYTILFSILSLSFIHLLVTLIKSETADPKTRKMLLFDIQQKKILVEDYQLIDGKVFEEPEHGGFIYFFKTNDDKVFVTFDSESQDLAMNDEDASKSSFSPKNKLRLEKTPNANVLINEEFSGDELDVPEPLLFTANTKIWPEFDGFIDVSWSKIESKFTDK